MTHIKPESNLKCGMLQYGTVANVAMYLDVLHVKKGVEIGCGESIKDSVFGGSVLGGSVFLTSDILIRPHKPNP